MRKSKLSISTLLMGFSCCGVNGEIVSPGDESNFQTSLTAEVRAATPEQEVLTGLPKVYSDFVNKHAQDKKGMVIGRGNVQGVAEERITITALKGLSWLFVDPGDAGVDGYLHDNTQDTTQKNALATAWPVDFSVKGVFDAVVFDYGTTRYIGDDGSQGPLGREYFEKQMELVITKADGTKLSKNSFQYPCQFQTWLLENNPPEHEALKKHYEPFIFAAIEKQKQILQKGLLDAYLALRRGGVLILPVDGSIDGIDLVSLLSISAEDLGQWDIASMSSSTFEESPVLPQLTRGMGTSYGDFYSITKK